MIHLKRRFFIVSFFFGVTLLIIFQFNKPTEEEFKVVFHEVVVQSANHIEPHIEAKRNPHSHYRQPEKFPLDPENWELGDNEDNGPMSNAVSNPLILLYDSLRWWQISDDLHCPNEDLKCRLTDETKYTHTCDAFIAVKDAFHQDDMTFFHKYLTNKKLIYYTLEPVFSTSDFTITNRKIEMFASFWRGSDFWIPYYKWIANPQSSLQEQNESGLHVERNYAQGKTKLAAIVVSNCYAPNDRLLYVEELQKFIEVDVYGTCGSLDCGTETISCFEFLKMHYKFYLAFENSNCRDYITEKLFRNALELRYEMVPVTMGAHPDDYKAVVPKNSYISVEDFNTPEDLATYLDLLDKNDSLYNEYFQWKNTGKYQPINFLCEVCSMLYKFRENSSSVTESRLQEGFQWGFSNREGLCLPHGKWYIGIGREDKRLKYEN